MVQFFPRMRAPLSVNQAALVGCRKSQRFGSDGQARSGVMWKGQQHRKEDKSDSDGNCLAVNGIALADCLRICIAERRHRKLTHSPTGCNGAGLHFTDGPPFAPLVIERRASEVPDVGTEVFRRPIDAARSPAMSKRSIRQLGEDITAFMAGASAAAAPAGLVKAALTNHMPFGTICQTSPR